jgi:formate dehydrogenase major subunit
MPSAASSGPQGDGRRLNGYADWEIVQLVAKALGLDWNLQPIRPRSWTRSPAHAQLQAASATMRLDEHGSLQWPANDAAPDGHADDAHRSFVRGKGKFVVTDYVPTDEKTGPRFPLLLTTGRILSHYNVGAQTRRTENTAWHPEDVLEIHPHDAENRGIKTATGCGCASRAGETTLRRKVTDRVAPGVVYTTFHHPDTQANVITTDYSDWATNCPEYKVTAVQVVGLQRPAADWQEFGRWLRRIFSVIPAKAGIHIL